MNTAHTTTENNETGYRCQGECWGEIPNTIRIDSDDNLLCGDCGWLIEDGDGFTEPDREDPDPEFHNSNFYDINTPRRS